MRKLAVMGVVFLFIFAFGTVGCGLVEKTEKEGAVGEEPVEEPVREFVEEKPDGTTLGQKNALRSALEYLDYSSFSYSGLVEQLKYEGYTQEEAVYGADNCRADWNKQAALKAQEYLVEFRSPRLIIPHPGPPGNSCFMLPSRVSR